MSEILFLKTYLASLNCPAIIVRDNHIIWQQGTYHIQSYLKVISEFNCHKNFQILRLTKFFYLGIFRFKDFIFVIGPHSIINRNLNDQILNKPIILTKNISITCEQFYRPNCYFFVSLPISR